MSRKKPKAPRVIAPQTDNQLTEKKTRQYKPKAGPGQVFKRELVGMKSGHAKRYRNIGATPLLLAYERGQLDCAEDRNVPCTDRITAEDRFSAGERFEETWQTVNRTGMRDSTDVGIGGHSGLFWTEARQDASDRLHELAARMQSTNYRIVAAFCGVGHSMVSALRIAGVVVHPVGTAYRIREALDDLVRAMTGRGQSASRVDNPPQAATKSERAA